MRDRLAAGEKPLLWASSSKRDFLTFPETVVERMGWALSVAQFGGKHPSAKPWKGLGPGTLEVVESFDGNAYRAVYTVRFALAVYVLHCFQKKSPRGVETARHDVELVRQRLRSALADYEVRYGKEE